MLPAFCGATRTDSRCHQDWARVHWTIRHISFNLQQDACLVWKWRYARAGPMGEIQIQAEIPNRRPQDADVDSVYAEETGLDGGLREDILQIER